MPKFAMYTPIYQAFEEFIERCLLGEKSLLWPEQTVWTLENILEVKRRFADNPLYGGDRSFPEKLQEQMKGSSPEHWMIFADIYYIYGLPSSFMTSQGKRASIGWVREQGRLEQPTTETTLWQALERGFARTGQRYHLKYPQFLLLILFAIQIKQQSDPTSIIRNPARLQQMLDAILESIPAKFDRASDTRNSILYMAFPDEYEPIISNNDKDRIIQKYGGQLGKVPSDRDEALRQIRAVLSKKLDTVGEQFSFYGSIKNEWKPTKATNTKVSSMPDEDEPVSETEAKVIFLSYRRDDSADTTGRIYDWLVKDFSEGQIFKDVDSIPLGINFKEHLAKSVGQCSVLVAIIGDKWLSVTNQYGQRRLDDPADFVRIEIEAALNRGIHVIPVFVQNAKPPQEDALPPALRELAWRQGMTLERDPHFIAGMEVLIRSLKEILKQA